MKEVSKKDQLIIIEEALKKFKQAWINCSGAFSSVDEETLNDIITVNYPFELDFDTLYFEVMSWLNDSFYKCQEMIKQEK